MKPYLAVILLLLSYSLLQAQEPVKKDIMKTLAKIPSPPATVKEAFSKVTTNNDMGSLKCTADKLFSSVEGDIKSVEDDFKAQVQSSPGANIPGVSPDIAKSMSDPAMRKKIKSMSKEDKMKMAMEMMKSTQAGQPVTESDPPAVRAALDEWQKVYNTTQEEFEQSAARQKEEATLTQEYEKSHAEIDRSESEEIAKLPQISSGEMSAPDPAKVKEVKLKAADKHIALANKRLTQFVSRWRASFEHLKKRYTSFYQKLVAAQYASESKNFSTKKILSDAQMTILTAISGVMVQSKQAWEESAAWQARRKNVEQQ